MADEKDILVTEKVPNMTSSRPQSAAWITDDDGIIRRMKLDPSKFGSLRGWIIYAPWAHPYWAYYAMFLVHLRPIAGINPPAFNLEGATHEMFLAALNPDFVPAINAPAKMLQPLNFSAQFIAASDEEAIKMIDEAARDVVNGVLSPDTDYIQLWIQRFGSSNIKGDPRTAGQTKIKISDKEGKVSEIVIPPKPAEPEKGGNA